MSELPSPPFPPCRNATKPSTFNNKTLGCVYVTAQLSGVEQIEGVYCSASLREKVFALLLRSSSPLRTAKKDNRKVILFFVLYRFVVGVCGWDLELMAWLLS